jgi:hypothetical protein
VQGVPQIPEAAGVVKPGVVTLEALELAVRKL